MNLRFGGRGFRGERQEGEGEVVAEGTQAQEGGEAQQE